jgi:hypothetical protein
MRTFIRKAFTKLEFALGKWRIIHGIRVGIFLPCPDHELLFTKVKEALDLMLEHAPECFSRVKNNARRIWIAPIPWAAGEWNDQFRTCALNYDYLNPNMTPPQLAAIILHEATHGLIYRRGISYKQPDKKRIESICFRAEMALGRRLPDGQSIVESAKLGLAQPESFWESSNIGKLRLLSLEEKLSDLQKSGAPTWAIRLIFPHWAKRLVERRYERTEASEKSSNLSNK